MKFIRIRYRRTEALVLLSLKLENFRLFGQNLLEEILAAFWSVKLRETANAHIWLTSGMATAKINGYVIRRYVKKTGLAILRVELLVNRVDIIPPEMHFRAWKQLLVLSGFLGEKSVTARQAEIELR